MFYNYLENYYEILFNNNFDNLDNFIEYNEILKNIITQKNHKQTQLKKIYFPSKNIQDGGGGGKLEKKFKQLMKQIQKTHNSEKDKITESCKTGIKVIATSFKPFIEKAIETLSEQQQRINNFKAIEPQITMLESQDIKDKVKDLTHIFEEMNVGLNEILSI